MDTNKIESAVRVLLESIGEDFNREGLQKTPERVARAYQEMLSGYDQNPEEYLKTVFHEGACKEMVVLKNIEFTSFCEHHILPFMGHVIIGYIPNEKVVGISKLARVVDLFAKRLQIQERMTTQIADCIDKILAPKGVMVIIKSKHLCIACRGANKKDSVMITSAIRGIFETDPQPRTELLDLVR